MCSLPQLIHAVSYWANVGLVEVVDFVWQILILRGPNIGHLECGNYIMPGPRVEIVDS
jgi:hypothetical protein